MINKRIFLWMGLLLGMFVLVGCGQVEGVDEGGAVVETAVSTTDESDDKTEATAIPVPRGVTILADGLIKAELPPLPLGFTTSGKLLTLNVQAGDVVQQGDLIATLDDTALNDNIITAQLQLSQAETNVAQAQADLDKLLNWEEDMLAVELAQANLAAAQAGLENAQTADAASGNSATSARVSLEQAERALVDAQNAQTTAYDPGREWELGVEWLRPALENERKAADRNLEFAQEQVQVARANYSLSLAGINDNTAVSAQASVVNAQQALDQAQKGPQATEIEAAERNLQQAEISRQQNQLSLEQAQRALADAQLFAPWTGSVLSVDVAPGAFVGNGTPIITLLGTTQITFHTTNLSERDLAQLATGQTAQITLKAYPNDNIAGTVQRIGVQAEGSVGDAATFPVVILLSANELDIRPGMTGRVEIVNEINDDN